MTSDDTGWLASYASDGVFQGCRVHHGPTRALAALWAGYQEAWPLAAEGIMADAWSRMATR